MKKLSLTPEANAALNEYWASLDLKPLSRSILLNFVLEFGLAALVEAGCEPYHIEFKVVPRKAEREAVTHLLKTLEAELSTAG